MLQDDRHEEYSSPDFRASLATAKRRTTIAQRPGTMSQKEEGERTVSTFRDDPFN